MKLPILFFLSVIFSITFIIAPLINNPNIPLVRTSSTPTTTSTNNNTLNVNNSIYLQGYNSSDFWKTLEDQSGLTGNKVMDANLTINQGNIFRFQGAHGQINIRDVPNENDVFSIPMIDTGFSGGLVVADSLVISDVRHSVSGNISILAFKSNNADISDIFFIQADYDDNSMSLSGQNNLNIDSNLNVRNNITVPVSTTAYPSITTVSEGDFRIGALNNNGRLLLNGGLFRVGNSNNAYIRLDGGNGTYTNGSLELGFGKTGNLDFYSVTSDGVYTSIIHITGNNSNFGVGTTTPSGLFSVGVGAVSPFTVDASGNTNSSGNITAFYFVGNGSKLTDVCLSNGSNCVTPNINGTNINVLQINSTNITATNITDKSLTSGRITYATTGGLLTDTPNLTITSAGLMTLKGTATTDGLTLTGRISQTGITGTASLSGSSNTFRGGAGAASNTLPGAGGFQDFNSGAGGAQTKLTGGTGGAGGRLTFVSGEGGASTSTSGTASGGNGGVLTFDSGIGGTASSSGTGKANGGTGGDGVLTAGSGGDVVGTGSSALGNTGGFGGGFTAIAGYGGNAYTNQINKGGKGGSIYFTAGGGGEATGGTDNTGGDAGGVYFVSALGGYGDDTSGADGDIFFQDSYANDLLILKGDNTKSIRLPNNNQKLYFTLKSSISYNGSDMLINPKEVGSGKTYNLGNFDAQNYSAYGNKGITGNYSMLNSSSVQCFMNYTSGLLTWSNC